MTFNCKVCVCVLFKFQRNGGTAEENTDLWIGFCAFHLGDYKRAMEVCVFVCMLSRCSTSKRVNSLLNYTSKWCTHEVS